MNGPFRSPWLNAAMPQPNFIGFSNFTISDALQVVQDNLLCPIVTTNQINFIGRQPIGQLSFPFTDADPTDTPGDQPTRL
jgi:hypothetical protein